MMELHFSEELQKEIYEQVIGNDRNWLSEAVPYVRRARRGYPPDDPRWTDQTTIDHILYYVTIAKTMDRDATLDMRNIRVRIKEYLDANPCIIKNVAPPEFADGPPMQEAIVEEPLVEEPVVETPPIVKKRPTKKKASKKKTAKKK